MITLEELCERRERGLLIRALMTQQERNLLETQERFGYLLGVVDELVDTTLTVLVCCVGDDKFPRLDASGENERHAQIIKLKHHVGVSSKLAPVIAELAARGHYSPAFALLRTFLEDTTKAEFYTYFPEEAATHLATGGTDGREIDVKEMRKRLGWDVDALGKFDGFLSKFVHAEHLPSHTNLLLPEFNEKPVYSILVATIREFNKLFHALLTVLSEEINQSPILLERLRSSHQTIEEVEKNIDNDLYEFSALTRWKSP